MSRYRSQEKEIRDARRAFLVRALSAGWLVGGAGWNLPALASLFGRVPGKLPPGKSVFEVSGTVTADGKPVTPDTVLTGRETLKSGPGSHLIAAVGGDAFVIRQQSSLTLDIGRSARSFFRLVSGAMLVVMAKRRAGEDASVGTPTATIGIRGTGVYFEADEEKSYVCTCYGSTQLSSTADPQATETIASLHHDAPRYILKDPDAGKRIVPAPFINHTDLELMTLEALVGRTVPFGLPADQYEGPRREDY